MEGRILVVDDERDICDILQFNLENEGYTVD
ncbi:MAG: DNA-binding response regulator, partial [Bacteroidales bacterium]|nr:DNA-binding response regulator [Bacteroidales bacterium]